MMDETKTTVAEATPAEAAEPVTTEGLGEVTPDEAVVVTAVGDEPVDTDDVVAAQVAAAELAAENRAEEAETVAEETVDSGSRTKGAEGTTSQGDEAGDGKPMVRMLSVGQEVTGTVRRISEFGAFVDIGVGRDGLVHISELSPRRIAKVTDVLQEGQEATFWIKKLDRDRNRISLTMIEPGMKTIRNMEKGDIVQGTVTRLMPYGAFVDIGIGRDALLHVREMGERFVAKPEDVVQVGEVIDARIIDISRRRARVDLSIKGLRAEPEPEPEPVSQKQAAAPAPEPEEEVEDLFADVEVLSPFAAALRRAEEASGVKLNVRKEAKRAKRADRSRALQEDIMERTLSGNRR
jgi:predicted RNA-binding protein with RPS1 domain